MSFFSRLSFMIVVWFAGLLHIAQTVAKSVIVDDADTTKITYSPKGWNIGNTCTGCFAQPDKAQAKDGTWHDATASGADDLFFTFTFTGTSVDLRYIAIDIIETDFTFTTGTNVSYSIDGVQRGTAIRNPTDQVTYIYDQSLFKITGLTNTEHTLRVDLLKPSALLLDYFIYEEETTDSSSSSGTTSSFTSTSSSTSESSVSPGDVPKKKSSNIGPIIGGVIAGVVALLALALLVWYSKRRRKTAQPQNQSVEPILGSNSYAAHPAYMPTFLPPNAPPEPRVSTATTNQVPLSSYFYAPSEIPSQVTHTHSHVESVPYTHSMAGTDEPSGTSLIGRNLMAAPSVSAVSSSIPTNSPPMSTLSGLPPVSEVQRSQVSEKSRAGMSAYTVQNSTSPNNFYTSVVANRVQPPIPNEPVEEGLMSRHVSMKSVPPPYSPGAIWHDDDAPPLPSR